jgi:SHS family lactate transporter-like MFS transporter
LAPPQLRSAFPGICYQLGNMISAPAAQIASTISESLEIHVNGETRPDYAITQAAMMSVIFTLLLIWTACGNEQRGSHFELAKVAGNAETDQKTRQLEEAEMEEKGAKVTHEENVGK